jgi:hypothetical protein
MLNFMKRLQGKSKGKRMRAGKGKEPPLTLVETAALDPDQGVNVQKPGVRRKILVVEKDYAFSSGVMDYATHLAARLGYDLIALNVLERPGKIFSPSRLPRREKFTREARAAWETVKAGLARQGIKGEQVVKFGTVARAVKDLNQEIKRIDFVITAPDIKTEEITGEIPLPVFSISGYQGEKVMAQERESIRSKPWGKTIAFGALTAVLYAAVFLNGGTVMNFFTRGGWYAALPITTVFIFSFAHGAFANYLWSALGIEAGKRVQPRPAAKRPVQRRRPRPELRLNA